MIDPPAGYLGAEGPLSSGPSPALVDSGYRLEIADSGMLHHGLGLADLAHVQELLEVGVIPRAAAVALTRSLLEILQTPPEEFPYQSIYGDAYNSRERILEQRLGTMAGWLPAGRTRREAGRIAFRIALRSRLLDLHGAVLTFAEILLERARQHAGTIWNDTTYLQPAQPSSFGHYLAGFAEESVRNLDRIEHAHRWANLSPAGAGGVAGTSLPFDRERMALRLGFDGAAAHTRDAMWSVDGLTDALVAATQSVLTADRLAEDLEIYASPQFGYVSLAGSASRASVLLPQKRNPYALAVIRGGAGTLIGRTAGGLATQRTPSARTDNWLYAYGETIGAVELATRLLNLAAEVMRGLEIHSAALTASAGAHFSTAGDLAERLVVDLGTDYRTAYKVVGRAVANATAAGVGALVESGLQMAATELGLPITGRVADVLRTMADPAEVVARRDTLGGSSPSRVLEHHGTVLAALGAHRDLATRQKERIVGAEAAVVAEAEKLTQPA